MKKHFHICPRCKTFHLFRTKHCKSCKLYISHPYDCKSCIIYNFTVSNIKVELYFRCISYERIPKNKTMFYIKNSYIGTINKTISIYSNLSDINKYIILL